MAGRVDNLYFFLLAISTFFSLLIAGWSMDRKARAVQMPLMSGPGRKAVFSLLPPILAAAAQSLPDLGILANSSRLLRQKLPTEEMVPPIMKPKRNIHQ